MSLDVSRSRSVIKFRKMSIFRIEKGKNGAVFGGIIGGHHTHCNPSRRENGQKGQKVHSPGRCPGGEPPAISPYLRHGCMAGYPYLMPRHRLPLEHHNTKGMPRHRLPLGVYKEYWGTSYIAKGEETEQNGKCRKCVLLPAFSLSLLSDSNQRPRDCKSRALAN